MQQASLNVAFMINSLEGGGAERVMCNLLSAMESYFTSNQLCVYLILLDDLPEAHTCPAYVNKVTLNTHGSLLKGYRSARQMLEAIKPQFCFSFLTRSNMVNIALARSFGYQAIISERVNTSSHFAGGFKDTVSKLMVKMSYRFADNVVAVSQGVKADLQQNFGVPEARLQVIHNPYDIAQLKQLADKPVDDLPPRSYIIGTGRLVKNKNFSLLLNAFAQSELTDDLLILGQGDEQASLVALARQLGIAERVHFSGFRSNPYPYLKHARFFVSTSNAEGFPNAIVEAMCLGKPVAATNCESGPAEILSGEYPFNVDEFEASMYGCLCQVNQINGVVQALNFLNNESNLDYYAGQSRLRAQDFSYAVFREKIIQTIKGRHRQSEEMNNVHSG
ncbi:glycosyltransferase [Alteromonas lipotrueiana]|uniref:glycosyltransferase n=1 Tax=Alteromonas lipotrueiana TaxID=2803815 RepID=UPI001C446557|nr:glycosyltransferase [Alteromonas lipotrueiana]